MYYQKPYELRNIKKTPDNTYQVQFIREGKSYSDYAYSLKEAKHLRDLMERKLGLINQEFHEKPLTGKRSVIPDSNDIMQAGVSQHFSEKRGQYQITAHWYDINKKPMTKTFYAGTENTFPLKAPEAYERAVEFRESWEDAVICERLADFNPYDFNRTLKESKVVTRHG